MAHIIAAFIQHPQAKTNDYNKLKIASALQALRPVELHATGLAKEPLHLWNLGVFGGIYLNYPHISSAFAGKSYRNDPKFSERQIWANSADPDQTAPRGAVWSGPTLFAIPLHLLDALL